MSTSKEGLVQEEDVEPGVRKGHSAWCVRLIDQLIAGTSTGYWFLVERGLM